MLNEHKMEHARGTQQRTAVHMLVAILCFISTVLPSGGKYVYFYRCVPVASGDVILTITGMSSADMSQ